MKSKTVKIYEQEKMELEFVLSNYISNHLTFLSDYLLNPNPDIDMQQEIEHISMIVNFYMKLKLNSLNELRLIPKWNGWENAIFREMEKLKRKVNKGETT